MNFRVQQTYGAPLQPLPAQIRQPVPAYGPPSLPNIQKPIHGAGCDGWKPIIGPSIGTQQAIANNNVATIHSAIPEDTYLPPSSNSLHAVAEASLQVQPLPANLQLPAAGPANFNYHNDNHHSFNQNLGASISSGLGLTSVNVIKSEGIEVCLCEIFSFENEFS